MATTGFWPVKGRLKEVLAYAENPDKTTEAKYLDDDLLAAITYAENSSKTDKQMYVSGIDCSKHRAYEEMCAVKQKYGERGKVIAYHGYQSFEAGEVTPEEAHKIGKETARRMWGDRFQVLVTTHLNTDNIHNHFVINATSFKDGKKYRNQIGDHMELRKVSDAVCREYGKSVLENAPFYSNEKNGYWLRQNKVLSHRDRLKKDVDQAVHFTENAEDFKCYLECLGYRFVRDFEYAHPSVTAPTWERPIRLDNLGPRYTKQGLQKRWDDNRRDDNRFHRFHKPPQQSLPYYDQLIVFKRTDPDLITQLFQIFIMILRLYTQSRTPGYVKPLSPEMRSEAMKLEKTLEEYHFLRDNHIETVQDFMACKEDIQSKIREYEAERQHLRNKSRRAKPEWAKEAYLRECRDITAKLTPLRKQLKLCERIEEKKPQIRAMMEAELELEIKSAPQRELNKHLNHKTKERNYER